MSANPRSLKMINFFVTLRTLENGLKDLNAHALISL